MSMNGAFLLRPIEDDWPYVWRDAPYVKSRQNGCISMAILIKFGANNDDRREVLGMAIGASETET